METDLADLVAMANGDDHEQAVIEIRRNVEAAWERLRHQYPLYFQGEE